MRKGTKYYEDDFDDGYYDEPEDDDWYAEEEEERPAPQPKPELAKVGRGKGCLCAWGDCARAQCCLAGRHAVTDPQCAVVAVQARPQGLQALCHVQGADGADERGKAQGRRQRHVGW